MAKVEVHSIWINSTNTKLVVVRAIEGGGKDAKVVYDYEDIGGPCRLPIRHFVTYFEKVVK